MIYKIAVLLLSRDSRAKHFKLDLDKEKGGLSLKLFAEGTLLSEFAQKVLKSVEEIKTRAADINAVAEIQSDASGTAILTVIHNKKQAWKRSKDEWKTMSIKIGLQSMMQNNQFKKNNNSWITIIFSFSLF